jgi:hypothetical protein
VSGQHDARARFGEGFQRGERPLAVGGRGPGDYPGASLCRVGIEHHQRVAGDHGVALRQVQRAVAERVPRREDYARRPRHRQRSLVSVAVYLGHRRRPVGARAHERGHDRQGARLRGDVGERGALAPVKERFARERHVVLVNPHRYAELSAGPLGEADVVEVGVREHDGLDIREVASESPSAPFKDHHEVGTPASTTVSRSSSSIRYQFV